MAHRRDPELGPAHFAVILYALSLGLPAIVVHNKPMFGSGEGHPNTLFGIQCLLLGYWYWPGWIANPLFYVGALFYRFGHHTAAAMTLVLAAASALAALVVLSGDSLVPLEHVHVGYFVWLASIVLMFVACVRRPPLRMPYSPEG